MILENLVLFKKYSFYSLIFFVLICIYYYFYFLIKAKKEAEL